MGQRLTVPVVLIGSLFALAFVLYAVDTSPVQQFIASVP
jgi:hypothetical protein